MAAFQPFATSTPVKVKPSTRSFLYIFDEESDASGIETPAKRRNTDEPCWVDLNDTDSNSTIAISPICSRSHQMQNQHKDQVCIHLDNETSTEVSSTEHVVTSESLQKKIA